MTIGIHLSSSAPSPLTGCTLATNHRVGVLDIVAKIRTAFAGDFAYADFDEWTSCSGGG